MWGSSLGDSKAKAHLKDSREAKCLNDHKEQFFLNTNLTNQTNGPCGKVVGKSIAENTEKNRKNHLSVVGTVVPDGVPVSFYLRTMLSDKRMQTHHQPRRGNNHRKEKPKKPHAECIEQSGNNKKSHAMG